MYGTRPVYDIEGGREVVVRIRRRNVERYPEGTRAHLQGVKGYVVLCNEVSMWGGDPGRPGRAYKVRFHRPVRAWWGRYRIHCWWFSPADLRKTRSGTRVK